MSSIDLSGRVILVVDDIRYTRLSLIRTLSQFGATMHEAADGEAALSALETLDGRVDCVLSDLLMPVLDGVGLLKAIRAGHGRVPRDLNVVFLSGLTELDRLGPALLLDLDAFLTKPTSKDALARCLSRVFARRNGVDRFVAETETYRRVDLAALDDSRPEDPAAPIDADTPERRVALDALAVGQVLSRDLLFPNGRLLLGAGSVMTRPRIDNLKEILALSGISPDSWIVV